MSDLYFVRREEDWIRHGDTEITVSSYIGEPYGPEKLQTDDPADPWWSTSGTSQIDVDFNATREVGVIALIMNNADDDRDITISNGITGTIKGKRENNTSGISGGYPRDVALIVSPAASVTGFRINISANSVDWAVGRLVAGKLRSVENFLESGFQDGYTRGMVVDEGIPEHSNAIIYDVGVDTWKIEGNLLILKSAYADFHNWWAATFQGVHPTLVIPDPTFVQYPPLWAYMQKGPNKSKEKAVEIPLSFVTVGRGHEVR